MKAFLITSFAMPALLLAGALAQETVNTDGGVIDAKRDQKFFKADTYSPSLLNNSSPHSFLRSQRKAQPRSLGL